MIPIFQAKKIDSDELVEGSLSSGSVGNWIEPDNSCTCTGYEIDPSTLKISFDGDSWYSVESVKSDIEKELLEKQRLMSELKMRGV